MLIVRKPPNPIPAGFIHVPQLSPSQNLFNRVQRWKKSEYIDAELLFLKEHHSSQWEKEWWPLYVRDFTKEMENRKDLTLAIHRLKEVSKDRNVFCFCYCKNHEECHRGILGETLKQEGVAVSYDLSLFEKK